MPRSGRVELESCLWCRRPVVHPLARWLLLLGAVGWFGRPVSSSSSVDCSEPRAGVDLMFPLDRLEYDPGGRSDAVRRTLAALERRFVQSGPDQSIVFFQLRHFAPGEQVAGEAEDDTLTMAIETFTGGQQHRGWTVFRFSRGTSPSEAMQSFESSSSWNVLVLLLLPDLTDGSQTLVQQVGRTFPMATKLLLLADCPDEDARAAARTVLRNLWATERVLSALAVWYRCPPPGGGVLLGLYDPFASSDCNGSSEDFHVTPSLEQAPPARSWHRLNLNRAPLDIYGFEAAMAYRRKDIDRLPRTFPPRVPPSAGVCPATPDAPPYLDGLFGADVEALRELAARLNFTPRVHHEPANFGFRAPNGSFTGVLGHLVTARDSWLSMNVYFLKDYETRDVQFTAAVYQDSLCVFVKAAGMLPDWLLIFRCFTPTLWVLVWGTVALVSMCYVALSQLIASVRLAWPASAPASAPPPVGTLRLVGQIVGALLSAPTNGLQRTTTHQRLFVAFGLVWGMTMTGAFQGSLVDVYTTPTSMKNLDTLAELDASRLPIAVSAPALAVDVFGTERPGNTIGNLRRRLVLQAHSTRPTGDAVLTGSTAALIRNQDFMRLSTKYLGRAGHARLHRLRECPRSYTLAYLYPRGSPLYPAANWHILHFLQHGLYARWERDAAHALAMNRAFKVRQVVASSDNSQADLAGQVQLRLDHLLLPFMLLGGGLALAGLLFTGEQLRAMCVSRTDKLASSTSCVGCSPQNLVSLGIKH